MSNRIVTFSPEARTELVEGVNILANAVGTTLGPRGRNVVIDTYGVPSVTKDGVTVADAVRLNDPIKSLGANIVKQAAKKTADKAGDGTTTATVLAQALINSGVEMIANGMSPIDIKRGYEQYLSVAIENILNSSKPVNMDNIKQIATISANNDPVIGNLIHEGFSFVGTEGMVTVEDSRTAETFVTTVEGTQIKSGWVSPHMVTDQERMEAVYELPLILITDKKIKSTQEILPALEIANKTGRPLVIIADEFDAQVLAILVVNRLRLGLKVVGIRAPAFGERRAEILKDLATLTGAELMSDAKAIRLESITPDMFGSCDKIIVSQDESLIISPKGDFNTIQLRIAELKTRLSKPDTSEQAPWIQEKLNERLASLTGKIAVFYVGAATETELKEKKDRIDDALRATKSAITLGYVPGAGLALVLAANEIDDIKTLDVEPIKDAFVAALNSPHNLILSNADLKRNIFYEPELKAINALTNELVNPEKAGIIDPTLVVTEALTNAVSAANMVLLSEVTIHDIAPKYEPAPIDQY